MVTFLEKVCDFLWGGPLTVILLTGGLFLSAKLKFPQIHILRIFVRTKKIIFRKSGNPCENSSFGAFSTALASTVGTGSVTGVGTALFVGGPGAIFWMWVSAFLGMGISYCENFLGGKYYGKSGKKGAVSYLENIGRGKILAVIYALCSVLASFGMGTAVQANSAVISAKNGLGISPLAAALCVLIFTAVAVSGGKKAVKICSGLVPFMSLFFCVGSILILAISPEKTLNAFKEIFICAFSPKAFTGGFLGSAVCQGLKRGAFSNEAGLGSSVSANSAGGKISPENQGILGMAEVFVDTMIICTITALVIISSGDFSSCNCVHAAYKSTAGVYGEIFLSITLILFSLATIAGWFYIGEKSWKYLFSRGDIIYKCLCVLFSFTGGVYSADFIWNMGDIFNALMAIPNMFGVLLLSKEVSKPDFDKKRQKISAI